jgi:hypothetical protein
VFLAFFSYFQNQDDKLHDKLQLIAWLFLNVASSKTTMMTFVLIIVVGFILSYSSLPGCFLMLRALKPR